MIKSLDRTEGLRGLGCVEIREGRLMIPSISASRSNLIEPRVSGVEGVEIREGKLMIHSLREFRVYGFMVCGDTRGQVDDSLYLGVQV